MALPTNALTTVETLCGELGIDVPASGSAALRDLERRISVASSAIERYCDRTFALASRTEKVPGYCTDVLRVGQWPVVEVTSIALDGTALDATSYTCAGDDARVGFIRATSGPWEDTARWQRGGAPERMAGTEELTYEVSYSAGYVLPKDGTESVPATLPPEIEEACLLTCVATYRAKGRDAGIASESMLGASVSYVGSTVNTGIGRGLGGIIPDSAVAMLAPYRRVL